MKKVTLIVAILALTAVILLGALPALPGLGGVEPATAGPAGGMIINHGCTDITAVPEDAILQAKSQLSIAYWHTSHGSQVTEGMSGLVDFMNGKGYTNNLYLWNGDGSSGALTLDDHYGDGGDLGGDWETVTRNYLGATDANGRGSLHPGVNVIMWSWCGQASYSDIPTYCSKMNGLETDYPGVNFVYMTGHLDGTGEAGDLNQHNQQIRDYCAANNKILYDFADIESYDPDQAVNYMQLFANDNCTYDSNGNGYPEEGVDANWALDWQAAHTEGVDWYSCSCAHSQALNGNQKAYAAWWMFARIAGWDDTVDPTAPAISSFSPTYGGPGQTVTIDGANFGTVTGTVTIGGVNAAVTSWSDTRVVVTVPDGAVFGKVVVNAAAGPATSARDFLPVVSTWYFAEGYTGTGTFQEYLCLGNPTADDAHARAVYLYTDGTTKEQDATIAAGSRSTLDVNATAGADKSLSAVVVSDQPIAAERPMYFNYGSGWTGGHDVMGAPAPDYTWSFAEGYTGPMFEEYICVLNPGDEPAGLVFRFQTQEAGEIVRDGYSVGAHSRGTFKVNDILGPNYQTSLTLEASQPVVAERPMYFNYQSVWTGGHCVMGATTLGTEYYFAEGTTRAGFHEWLTLQNPTGGDIEVEAVYQLGTGQGPNISKTYIVGAGERATVFVQDEVGAEKDVSIRLTSGTAFLAERPMYFNYGSEGWTGGHCVIGAQAPGRVWFFAEGYTGEGFQEWLCLQNPGDTTANVAITYFTQEAGELPTESVYIAAGTRLTIPVNVDAGEGYQLSVLLKVMDGPDIVAERPMYFDFRGWTGGHDVVGFPQP